MLNMSAIFLDRDGVINYNRSDYVKSWDEFEFLPGVLEALAHLAKSPFRIVIVTNQSAIGRRLASRRGVEDIHSRMKQEICKAGGRLDAIYYCPHIPEDGCDCRKPRPGLLFMAAEEHKLDLARSWLVGDNISDVEAACAAGVQPVLVRTGQGNSILPEALPNQVLIFDDLRFVVRSLFYWKSYNEEGLGFYS